MCLKMLSWVIFFSLFQDVLSDTCSYYKDYVVIGVIKTTYYCSGYCCGSNSVRKCCSYSNSGIGIIIGIAIGALVGLCIIIMLICLCVRACTRTRTRGTVIMPAQNPAFVMTSDQQNCQQAGYAGYPPTYNQGPPAAYPPAQMPYPPAPAPVPGPAPAPGVPTGNDPALPAKN